MPDFSLDTQQSETNLGMDFPYDRTVYCTGLSITSSTSPVGDAFEKVSLLTWALQSQPTGFSVRAHTTSPFNHFTSPLTAVAANRRLGEGNTLPVSPPKRFNMVRA